MLGMSLTGGILLLYAMLRGSPSVDKWPVPFLEG